MSRQPIYGEQELRFIELERDARNYSYDLVQRLTFFVISIELIFCGYILLSAEKLGVVKCSSLLFLLAGIAAISGLLWRFFYNQTTHDRAHNQGGRISEILVRLQIVSYWIYVLITVVFFISAVVAGYGYLNRIEKQAANGAISEAAKTITEASSTSKPEQVAKHRTKTNSEVGGKEDNSNTVKPEVITGPNNQALKRDISGDAANALSLAL